MCVPLGHRNYGSRRSGTIRTKVDKEYVKAFISRDSSTVEWKPKRCRLFRKCDKTTEELIAILNDAATEVVGANTFNPHYKRGFYTIVMEAKSIGAVFVIRD